MSRRPYGLICPISKACEILEPRWTIQILTALWSGATRFNEIRRDIGNISPALLSRRLKELEELKLIERIEDAATGSIDYIRTRRAIELEPVMNGMAEWAQRNIEADLALCENDISTLMWWFRRKIVVDELPDRRIVVRFHFGDVKPPLDTYWMLSQPGAEVELCINDPGYEVDLYIETSSLSLGAIYTGRTTISREIADGEFFLSGSTVLARTIERWLKQCDYAAVDGISMLPRDERPASLQVQWTSN
ncbi:MAG: winged helix-turn-helix transcriptional regulator [Rhizobiaceae bacterium]